MLKIFHSDRFVPKLPEGHRFPISKYQLIREQLLYEGTILESQLEECQAIEAEYVLAVHQADYWQRFVSLSFSDREVRRMGFPQSESLVDRSRRSCYGTFAAAKSALKYGIGMNIAGGTHHAYADHAEGFCLLNDIAISAHDLLKTGAVKKVLIVDLDVHQGNGSAVIFAEEARVFTFSMHGKDNYPLRKERSDLDIALPTRTQDNEYLNRLREQLPRLIERVKPDLIYFQSGVDVLESDKLGHLSLTRQGCKTRDRIVMEACAERQIPLVVAIGGGYSERLVDTVEAHANTFRLAAEIFH
ncbi:MAG: histone deacetylase [Bacteroidota bacterium]